MHQSKQNNPKDPDALNLAFIHIRGVTNVRFFQNHGWIFLILQLEATYGDCISPNALFKITITTTDIVYQAHKSEQLCVYFTSVVFLQKVTSPCASQQQQAPTQHHGDRTRLWTASEGQALWPTSAFTPSSYISRGGRWTWVVEIPTRLTGSAF